MYYTFTRTWWRENPRWPNGLEPQAGRKRRTGHTFTHESEAQRFCKNYNETHNPGRLSRKCEYEREGAR